MTTEVDPNLVAQYLWRHIPDQCLKEEYRGQDRTVGIRTGLRVVEPLQHVPADDHARVQPKSDFQHLGTLEIEFVVRVH